MKYAVNQTQTNVGLLEGKYLIPIGGWVEIRDDHASSEEVGEVIRRGWIKLQLVSPDAAQKFEPDFKIENPKVQGSLEFPKPKSKDKAAKKEKATA